MAKDAVLSLGKDDNPAALIPACTGVGTAIGWRIGGAPGAAIGAGAGAIVGGTVVIVSVVNDYRRRK